MASHMLRTTRMTMAPRAAPTMTITIVMSPDPPSLEEPSFTVCAEVVLPSIASVDSTGGEAPSGGEGSVSVGGDGNGGDG